MTFFEPDPAPAPVEPDEAPRDPRNEPPFDELPALAPIGVVLASTDNVVIALTGARVFSDGVEFAFERKLRRGTMSRAEFQRFAQDDHFVPDDEDRGLRRRYGILLADGQRLEPYRNLTGHDDPPEVLPHVLVPTGGHGGGSESRYVYHDGLWLHPLPPPGPIEIVVQWPAVGIPETRTVVDDGRILLAAADARPLWAD